MVSANAALAVTLLLSVACTVKLYVPAVLGMPLSNPPDVSVNPRGSAVPPVKDHVYGAAPPLAVRFCLYAMFTSPVGSGEGVVMTNTIEREKVLVTVPPALSVTVAAKLPVPVVVGVPVIAPVVLSDNAANAPGNGPTGDQV
jgi:hypothetical protein